MTTALSEDKKMAEKMREIVEMMQKSQELPAAF
jgi:hypothetical protein